MKLVALNCLATVGEGRDSVRLAKSGRKMRRARKARLAADAPDRQRALAQQPLGEHQALLGQVLLEAFAKGLLEDAREIVARKAGVARQLTQAERFVAMVDDEASGALEPEPARLGVGLARELEQRVPPLTKYRDELDGGFAHGRGLGGARRGGRCMARFSIEALPLWRGGL